jgi:glucokinase-like ROK family protein
VNGLVGSFQLMKSLNKTLVLNVIRRDGPISRAEIAKKTNLTPPTVTNLVNELLSSHLVVETELGTSNGGRKPIMLTINSHAYQVIGVDVGGSHMKGIATSLDGTVIFSNQVKMPKVINEELFIALLIDTIAQIIEKAQLNRESILGIGIGMHGLVNSNEGISIYAPNFDLRNIPIRTELEREFGMLVEVENDVRAMALGESWFGNGQGTDNFVCVNVGMGVGAGIILNDQLFQGASFTAGEIGHTTIDMEGPRCSCGNYGCLQALIAGPAIASRTQKELRMGRRSVLAEWVGADEESITAEMIYQAALAGDALSIEMLEKAGRYLGIGIANLINTLNPMKVIIGGGVSKSGPFLLNPLKETVRSRALESPASMVSIEVTKLGELATAMGAATLILQKLFIPNYAALDERHVHFP